MYGLGEVIDTDKSLYMYTLKVCAPILTRENELNVSEMYIFGFN